ncbi:MAG: hypothetical protein V4586_16335 [Pseudomonadota bacterium]
MTPKLTVFFIVEPPDYEVMACYLAASLREQFGDQVALVGYCPDIKLDLVSPNVKEVLRRMSCEVRPFVVEGRFSPAYPHGNKILATMEPRDTEFSAFFDSDILCLRPNRVENIIMADAVSLTPAASMNWGKTDDWNLIYAACGMAIPAERIKLMRQSGERQRIPYFSSGLFSFPEQHRSPDGRSFPQVWMDIAQTIDAHPDVPGKRPYLDQISMPLAIQKSGLKWNILPEEQHFILGGKLRGDALPQDREIFTVHYRVLKVLKETGLTAASRKMLKRQAGVKRIDKAGEESDDDE